MAVRTIKVDITGLKEIEKAQKSVSALRDSVLDFEKKLRKMGGKNTSSLSFNVNLILNTDKALKDYLALKKQIESMPIRVGSTKGDVSSTQGSSNSSSSSRPTFDSSYIKVKDQDYQSWRNLHKAVDDVTRSAVGLSGQMVKLGAIAPAKGLLSVFNSLNSTILDMQKNLMGLIGNGIKGALGSLVSGGVNGIRNSIGQLKNEANNLGDAMQVYRINMQALGFDEKTTNKSIKRLGDYGKSTVFDATDLLEQASTYTAYGRKDAEQIVKGYAGLLAQTKNPIEGMRTVTEQTSQMLASGVLNQQDYKFIRQRLSALGASKLNAELQKLAESKGADSIISATKKRLISADEYLDVVNRLGNDDTFQSLVNSIITPRQAIANLKETLSNLLVFDDIDEEGNAKPGALNRVYVATRDFIKGITDIVGTDKFKDYVTKLGNAIGDTIQSVNHFGVAWKLAFSKSFLDGIEKFASSFKSGVQGLNVGKEFFDITKSVLNVLNTTGRELGTTTKEIVKSISELTKGIVDIGAQLITSGFPRVVRGVVDIYTNLAKLAVSSGGATAYTDVLLSVTNAINTIIKSVNPSILKSVFDSIVNFVESVSAVVTKIATRTNIFKEIANVLKGVIDALSSIVNQVGTFNAGQVNKALEGLRNAILGIVEGIKPLIVELAKGAISALASNSAQRFFQAVIGFVKAVAGAIRSTLVAIGGSVEGGIKKILDFFTLVTNFASGVASLLGGLGKYLILGFIGTKFLSWATNIIYSLSTVATAMNAVSGGKVNPLGLANAFGSDALMRAGTTSRNVGSGGAYLSGMSRVAKNSTTGFSRVARNNARHSANMKGLGFIGAQVGLDLANNALQGSNASQGFKDFGNIASSTASWALTGAGIGSFIPGIGTALGAGIGGLTGFIAGLLGANNQKDERARQEKLAKEEASKQAEVQAKETLESHMASVKQLAEETANIRNSFFKSISSSSGISESLSTASAYIDSLQNSTGKSLESTLRDLNIKTATVPKGIENFYVKIGDKIKSWSELKESSGIQDDARLLQSLQLVKSTLGEKYVEFLDSEGNKVAEAVETLTKEESTRQSTNLDAYKAQLTKAQLSVKSGVDFLFKDITTITEEIDNVLKSRNFANNGEKAKAITEALEKAGIDTTEFVKLSISDQIAKATELVKQGKLQGGTREQQTIALAESIKEKLGDTATKYTEILKNGLWDDLNTLNQMLDSADFVSKLPRTEENQVRIDAFKESVAKLIKDGVLKVEEGQALLDKAGIKDVSAEGLKNGVNEFKLSVTNGLSDAQKKFLEGTGIIGGVDIPGIATAGISASVTGLKDAVATSINSAIAKLDEAIANAKQANDWDEVNALANERRITEYASRRYQSGGIIPEYHSNGLPVGINWKPKGTDTVPTMLTPGEYVLRKKAVDSLGTNFLNNLNRFGVNALQSVAKSTIINNVYNTNNAQISQNIDNKSQYLNGMFGLDKLMRYV
nr:MAG TPA: tail tape measure [Caudoviricetes sp.]